MCVSGSSASHWFSRRLVNITETEETEFLLNVEAATTLNAFIFADTNVTAIFFRE